MYRTTIKYTQQKITLTGQKILITNCLLNKFDRHKECVPVIFHAAHTTPAYQSLLIFHFLSPQYILYQLIQKNDTK
jgi:hypothetical protein